MFEDEDLEDLDYDLDIEFQAKPLRKSRSKSRKGKLSRPAKPRKPEPWDDDWQDPEDSY